MNQYSDIELDLIKIAQLGKQRESHNLKFRSFLKSQDPAKIDKIVHRLNAEISDQIDCTACGNCCHKLKPSLSDQDIERLSGKLDVETEKFKADNVEINDGVQQFKHLPCIFLHDKKCSVYSDRPDDCKSFPHLHKRRFTSRLWSVIDNYSICPIVFNVFERLKTELGFR